MGCRALILLTAFVWASCAQGYTGEPDLDIAAPVEVIPAPFTGEACMSVGDRVPCLCPNGVDTGLRACTQSEESPTKAALTGCLLCEGKAGPAGRAAAPSAEAVAGASAAGGGSAAAGNAAGAVAASAGGRGGASGAAGSAGMRAGGSGGSGGTRAASGTGGQGSTSTMQPRPINPLAPSNGPGCECTQACFPFGILPCCRQGGGCGCTWAPGAYCL